MKILALAGDAGGARALAPVIAKLRSQPGTQVECRAYAAASQIWQDLGFSPSAPAEEALRQKDRLLLGTSQQPEAWELLAIKKASLQGTPSIAVIDSWVHYRERFTDALGVLILPDIIAVMDSRARQEMIEKGFPADRLVITGNPVFDYLADLRPSHPDLANWFLDPAGPVSAGALRILYASQPLSQVFTREELGFHESEVLEAYIQDLATALDKHRAKALFLIKPHPRESMTLMKIPASPTSALDIRIVREAHTPTEAIAACQWVFGMNSNLLIEACYLHKPTISYQPDLKIADPLPSNRAGWSRPVFRREDLRQAIEEEIFDPAVKTNRLNQLTGIAATGGATDKVLALLSSEKVKV